MIVVFTVYNRPDCLSDTLNSWADVRGIDKVPVHFFVEPSEVVGEITQVVRRWLPNAGITYNGTKQGVLVNPWNALEAAFGEIYDFAILAEDDILVSTDVLEWFAIQAQRFHDNRNCVAVCANGGPGDSDPLRVDCSTAFNPLVWGTWRERWSRLLRDTWDKDYSTGSDGQSGWDWNINRIIGGGRIIDQLVDPAESLFVVKPAATRSQHIGMVGTHTKPESFAGSQLPNWVRDRDAKIAAPTGFEPATPTSGG